METVHGFWVGALAVSGKLDLETLAARCGGWKSLAHASVDDLLTLGVPYDLAVRWLQTPPVQTRGHAITRACPDYPTALRLLKGAPPLLFCEGDTAALASPGIAIVGTRDCSPLGASNAHTIAAAAVSQGLAVISGLARGIDTYAHRGALAANGRTIAVLGHGLSHTAPRSNLQLRERILDQGGLLLTTYPDDLPPERWTFPERNRWIAALARKLVLVEAPAKSGALITVERWIDLGRDRDLHVVPGPLGAESWQGSASLIAMGAAALVEIEQLFVDLGDRAHKPRPDWLTALIRGESLDDVARLRGVPAAEVLREVVLLELRGDLVRLPGGRYAASGGIW